LGEGGSTHGLPVEPFSALVRLLQEQNLAGARIIPMPGGASTRQYFRVLGKGAAFASAVVMYVPDGPTPEEIDKAGVGARWPFLEVRDLLAERNVQVPHVLAEDTANGLLVLEDLHDNTLAEWLRRFPESKPGLYTQAVRDLARAQRDLSALPPGSVVQKRAFDEDLLFWEIDHFREWGLEARGHVLSAEDASRFEAIGKWLAKEIAGYPRGFVHRDYQSRNLMVRELEGKTSLVWIDFQDALMGPRAYDLVALLGDSYQEFDAAFIEARLAEFVDEAKLAEAERVKLAEEFRMITVQRKLKDAGRFVFIDRKKNNPNFLPFVVPTVKKVARALRLLTHKPEMRELCTLLERYVGAEMAE
jgi:N-acetylmuramate 1-kinase